MQWVRQAEAGERLAQWVRQQELGVALIDSRGRLDQWRDLTAARVTESVSICLDSALLRKAFGFFGVAVAVIAPLMRDPLVVTACGFMPWALVSLVDRPRMPSIIVYYLLFMWLEMAARVVLASIDGEALGDGVYGHDVYRAMWYAMASLLVLAVVFRGCLNNLPGDQLEIHRLWPPIALFYVYLATAALSVVLAPLASLSTGIAQPVQAFGSLKYVAMFMLFATVLSTGNGIKLLLTAVLMEILTGFTGLFSDFKTVLIVLLLTALSLRITLRIATVVGGIVTIVVLLGLGLFWTAVKSEYREVATGFISSQTITAGLGERAGVLIERAIHPGEIEWGMAVDQLVRRIAYIDFFGATIGTVENAPEAEMFPRWRDALEHIAKPRLLFPGKAVLDDTEIFLRNVRDEIGDDSRPGTSISIGYLAENFIDFGFPGMLLPVAFMGLVLCRTLRYFMTRSVPWAVREGFITALVLTLGPGIELSLAKFLGGTIMVFAALALCLKFVYPTVERWIERRS